MKHDHLLQHMRGTFDECLELADKKNSDYAEDEDAFKNFRLAEMVDVDPDRAILVRISDKLSRVSNLLDREAQVSDEKLEDTLNDIINYTAILKAMVEDEEPELEGTRSYGTSTIGINDSSDVNSEESQDNLDIK